MGKEDLLTLALDFHTEKFMRLFVRINNRIGSMSLFFGPKNLDSSAHQISDHRRQ